jgi:hypothetical protein
LTECPALLSLQRDDEETDPPRLIDVAPITARFRRNTSDYNTAERDEAVLFCWQLDAAWLPWQHSEAAASIHRPLLDAHPKIRVAGRAPETSDVRRKPLGARTRRVGDGCERGAFPKFAWLFYKLGIRVEVSVSGREAFLQSPPGRDAGSASGGGTLGWPTVCCA